MGEEQFEVLFLVDVTLFPERKLKGSIPEKQCQASNGPDGYFQLL